MKLVHLTKRFLTSLVARPPDGEEEAWVASRLLPAEFDLWRRQNRYDRRHTYEVARRVEEALSGTPHAGGPWPAAALLHDIGKVEAEVGLVSRVVVTVAIVVLGRPRVSAKARRPGWLGRAGRYADHPRLGAELVERAGGRPEVARWAGIHHGVDPKRPGGDAIVPDRVIRALVEADSD